MSTLQYLSGFGNNHETEAVEGSLPEGRNSPQRVRHGLYAEQLSGTAFTAPRRENRRSWLYRMRPSAAHPRYRPVSEGLLGQGRLHNGPYAEGGASPNRLRWDPLPAPTEPTDFLEGMVTMAGNGGPQLGTGITVHLYVANRSMEDTAFYNADGELLIVPQRGRLLLVTEQGRIEAGPGEIAVIPRGLRFRVELPDGEAAGYVCENLGALLRLPELGPIGSNGLAAPRDFLSPVAAYEDVERPHRIVQKFMGKLWETQIDHSPFDVVAWHGNLAPYKYDLSRFNTIGTVSFDHPDPSIFTVLTSPSDTPGTANCDFVIFPPRWMVAEDTFRPPWFHRNVMSEYMGLIHGIYDAKEGGGFTPGGGSLHNCMSAHGPDRKSYEDAVAADLVPHKIDDTLAFMFESRWVIMPSRFAMESPSLQEDYDSVWGPFEKAKLP